MRLFHINPSAIADFFETRARHAHANRQRARLRRELPYLPRYIVDDIGAGPN